MTTKIKSGVISDNAITSAHISSGAISSSHLTGIDTDAVSEGSSNLYFTTTRARTSLSVTDSGGDGSLTYDNSTGAITYTGPSASEVRAHLSAGTGVTYSSGEFSIGQSVATSASPTFANLTLTGNLNITGDVDSVSVTDLDVTDKTITVGVGGTASANDGAGIVVDGASASILWDNSNTSWDFNNPIESSRVNTNTVNNVGNSANIIYRSSTNTIVGNNASALVVQDAGNVGIGTTSPDALLEVEGSNATGDGIRVGTSSNSNTGSTTIALQTNNADRVAIKGTRESSTGGKLTFETKDVGGSLTEKMVIKNDGNVGIGTNSPSDKLEIGTTTTGGNLRLVSSSYASNGLARFYGTDGNEKLQIGSLSGTSAYVYTPASTDLVIYTGGSEKMRIDSSGNVKIGTGSPSFGSGSGLEIERAGIVTLRLQNTSGKSVEITQDSDFKIESMNSGADILLMPTDNVGINDTNPSQKLSVSGTSSVVPGRFTAAGNTNTLEVFGYTTTDTSNGLLVNSGTSSNDYAAYFRKVDGTTPIMMIEGTGNIGIGTASPSTDYKLDVGHLNSGAIQARFKSSGDSGYTQGAITIESSVSSDSPSGRGQGVYMFNEANDMTWYAGTLYNTTSTYGIGYKSGTTLQHAAADQGEAGLSLAITTSGKVGIGTASPSEMLHIVGGGSGPEIRLANSSSSHYIRAYNDNWNFLANASVTAMTIRNDGDVEFGEDVDLTGGRIKVTNSGTDAYFFEGVRDGGNVTLRMYDNNNNLYIDSYTNMSFRCNQTGGGSGGQIYFGGGDVNIGSSTDSARYLIFDKTASGENGIIFRNASNNKGKILLDSSEFMQFYINGSTNAMTIRETKGQIDAAAVGGRFSGYVQDMVHIGADKSEVIRYGHSGKTWTDGGSSNYAGYVYGQETYLPGVFIPYSPNQVYRLSASIYQITNGTGYNESRHYIGVVGYDENFSFLSVDAIGTYQYNMASNTGLAAGNALEVDVTIKGWQGAGGSDGNKMDEGTVYIRPLILFNYQRPGGTAALTGFTMMPAGTISDNDSNAGTNY